MSEDNPTPPPHTLGIDGLLASVKRIAVLGIKTESQSMQPAFYVPAYLQRVGYTVIPVPVYYPEVTEILGQPVVRRLEEVSPSPDLVLVFRRPADLPEHLEALRASRPKAVWLQSGIRHDEVARVLTAEGIEVVQDRCMMVEHQSWTARQVARPI